MGTGKDFGKEILVMGILSVDSGSDSALFLMLEECFGPVEVRTSREEFKWTDYYIPEMGEPIWRYYVVFRDFVDPSELAAIKTKTNAIETMFSMGSHRRINLDPGLLAPGRFVLATTKDRAHRIALSEGIFAELTLIFEKGEFRAMPWTYPDWASEPVRTMLAGWRKRLFIHKS
jgi:hypothetical protein